MIVSIPTNVCLGLAEFDAYLRVKMPPLHPMMA